MRIYRVRASDGVDVAARDFGGEGPNLVLAHASGLHGAVWEPLAQTLKPSFRCVAFDDRAHGDSQRPPPNQLTWDGFARDALATVDSLGGGPLVGVGHSSGATALLLAEQARPGTFSAIYCYEAVLFAADPPSGPDPDNRLAAGARRRRDLFDSRQAAYENYASKPPFDVLSPAALHAYVDVGFENLADGGVRLKCRPEDEARVYEMGTAHDCYGHLGEVRCPVLLVEGSESEHVEPGLLEHMAGRLVHGRTEVITGLGHFGPLQGPETVARSTLKFLTGARDATTAAGSGSPEPSEQ